MCYACALQGLPYDVLDEIEAAEEDMTESCVVIRETLDDPECPLDAADRKLWEATYDFLLAMANVAQLERVETGARRRLDRAERPC